VICEFVVSTLQGLLANEETEKQFLEECAEACVYLPMAEQRPVRLHFFAFVPATDWLVNLTVS
jgi:hypothetical protein